MAFLTAILKLKDSYVTTGDRLVLFLLQDQIPKQRYPFQVTFICPSATSTNQHYFQ